MTTKQLTFWLVWSMLIITGAITLPLFSQMFVISLGVFGIIGAIMFYVLQSELDEMYGIEDEDKNE